MRLWHLFVPFIAISSLGAGYEAWRKSPPSKATEARRECFATAEGFGMRRSDGVELCNCLFGKARWYKWTHWGAEYTREVHMGFGKECAAQLTAKASEPSGWGTFNSGAPVSRPAAETPWGEAPDADAEPTPANRTYTAPPKQYGDPGYE